MALHISADVVLANLTMLDYNNRGIDFQDINQFCQKIKEKISELGITKNEELAYIYFEIDNFSIRHAIEIHPENFAIFKDRIFKKRLLELDKLNNRYSDAVKGILISSAEETVISNNEKQEYLNGFYEPKLTGNEFVRLLLSYLCNRGIRTIQEDELAKKLFPYFKNEKYRPLFDDLEKDRYADKVDIAEGMYSEKYFSGNIMWESSNPNSLRLLYGKDFATLPYEKEIDPHLVELLNDIADDFGVRNKIEAGILNVYGYNSNKSYSLVSEQSSGNYQSELITDGTIKKERNSVMTPSIMYIDPTERSTYRSYKEGISRTVSIKNSSFVVIQGIYNGVIQKIDVFSKIADLEKLLQIKEMAQRINDTQESLLLPTQPYVRKLVLK